MKVHITIEGKWIRADSSDCARPRNLYHAVLHPHFPFLRDVEMVVDSVMFNYGVRTEEITIESAYQWALDQVLPKFKNETV